MNIKKFLGSSFVGGCAFSSAVSCSPATAVQEGNFEAEFFQEFVQGGDLFEKIKELFCSLLSAIGNLFEDGGFNDSSKQNLVLWIERLARCMIFMDKLKGNIKIDKGIDKFDEEVKEYERRFTPSWLRELSEQYGSLGRIPEDCIPAEHREAFRFLMGEFERVEKKYNL